MEVRKAVIPAAGLGTRFLPATKAQPKEMLALVDKPVIQYVVEEAVASGIDDILIVTGRGKHAIENHFDKSVELEQFLQARGDSKTLEELRKLTDLAEVHYIRQPEPLGLGHAISLSEKHVDSEPFAVLLGDTIFDSAVPCTKQLLDVFDRHASSVIAAHNVERSDVSRWGIISGKEIGEGTYEVSNLVEKPKPAEAPSTLAIAARYVLTPSIFDCLRETKPGKNNEVQLTDALNLLAAREKVLAQEVEGAWYDVGTKADYAMTFIDFALRHPDIGPQLREHLKKILK